MTVISELRLKYTDSFERSSELLRLAIGLMAKQNTAPHPISYAVWYEYVSGRSVELNREITAILRNGELLSEELTRGFYQKYLLTPGEATVAQATSTLGHVIDEVAESAGASRRSTENLSESLAQLNDQLTLASADDKVTEGVVRVLRDTHEIKDALSSLRSVLEASRAEVEQLRQRLDQTYQEASSDALTGLSNRKGFNDALSGILTGDPEACAPCCLIMMDIDGFKRINDTFGHLVGDKVLRSIALTLQETVKGADIVARFGGDEFAVLLPRTSLGGAQKLANSICVNIARASIRGLRGEILDHVTISAGLTICRAGETEEDFVDRADAALYDSKRAGRNRVTVKE